MTEILQSQKVVALLNAMLTLKTTEELGKFCRDLMTEPEILEFASRWQIAQELDKGLPQRQVAAKTGISLATVTRVNQWLKRGSGGYRLVLDRTHHHSDSTLAATS